MMRGWMCAQNKRCYYTFHVYGVGRPEAESSGWKRSGWKRSGWKLSKSECARVSAGVKSAWFPAWCPGPEPWARALVGHSGDLRLLRRPRLASESSATPVVTIKPAIPGTCSEVLLIQEIRGPW
jgi:hypothetical protein